MRRPLGLGIVRQEADGAAHRVRGGDARHLADGDLRLGRGAHDVHCGSQRRLVRGEPRGVPPRLVAQRLPALRRLHLVRGEG
eukprot:scaffold15490_cov30-Phaeocystis_antarctica.AAC.1